LNHLNECGEPSAALPAHPALERGALASADPVKQQSDNPVLVGALFVFLLAIAAYPVFTTNVAPLADYPYHLARVYIHLAHAASAELQTYYTPSLSAQPNLAMDLVVPALARFMPLEVAGRVFIALVFFSLMAGTLVLHRVLFKQWSLWPLVAILFLYNRLLIWGFLAFLFTVGLSLFAASTWIALARRSYWLRFIVNSAWALIIFFGHLFAFGVYAIVVVGYELQQQIAHYRTTRRAHIGRLVKACLPLLVPLMVFVLASPPTGDNSIKWHALTESLAGWFYPFMNYSMALDGATAAVLFGLVSFALFKRKLSFSPALTLGLAMLVLINFAMPDQLSGSHLANRRIPVAFMFFAVAGANWRIDALRWRNAVLLVLGIAFAIRMLVINDVWAKADAIYSELLAEFDKLPRGAKLLDLAFRTASRPGWTIPLLEFGSYSIISKDTFVPSLYAYPKFFGQSVAFKEPYATLVNNMPTAEFRHIASASDSTSAQLAADKSGFLRPDVLACFDYMLVTHPETFTIEVPPSLVPVQRKPRFKLYEIPKSSERCGLLP